MNRFLCTAALAVAIGATAGLGGCAAMHNLDSEVSAFSLWPAERKPATYAFERLPSQQSRPEQQSMIEQLARPAVEAAGFTLAADAASADVTVQLGARITPTDRSPFDDPFWGIAGWHRPFAYGRSGRLFGPGWRYGGFGGFAAYGGYGPRFDDYGYEREVAVLIRDRKTGQPLYESRAVSDGLSPMIEAALPAMFQAALKDFPNATAKPRRVSIEMKS